MVLSKRACDYLAHSEWKDSVKDEKEIINAFQAARIMPTDPLIDFQTRFGGLIVMEPEDDIVIRHFNCADTLYQEIFSIDEQGRYYEGYDLKCNNFETHIESSAMLNQVNKGKWQTVYKYELDAYRDYYEIADENKYGELVKLLGLKRWKISLRILLVGIRTEKFLSGKGPIPWLYLVRTELSPGN